MTQFVYFYVQAPDNGAELKLSIASVRKNFVGDATFLVIGERPSWYDGPILPLKKFTGIRDHAARLPFRDTQHKCMLAANSDLVEEEFVWLADDVFILKPTTIEDLRVPRYDPWHRVSVKSMWQQLIRITYAALKKNGKSNLQYATHLPHVLEKTKLREMFSVYDFPQQLLLFDLLFPNHFKDPNLAVPYGGNWQGVEYPQFLRRLLRPLTMKQLDEIDAHVLNYQARCWNPQMKTWLNRKFGP